MTRLSGHQWIVVLFTIITLESSTLGFDPGEQSRDPLEPVATYGDARFRIGGWITSLCFSADGTMLASSSHRWGTAVWDAQTGELIRRFPVLDRNAHESHATFSPDSKLIVVAATDLKVWNVATGELLYKIEDAGQTVWDNRLVPFTRDGKHFLAVGVNEILLIETETGRTVHRFEMGGSWNRLNGVALAPDGSQAILGTYRLLEPVTEGRSIKAEYAVKIWDLATGKERLPRPPQNHFGETLKTLRVSPDGKSLVAVTQKFHFHQRFQLIDPQKFGLQRVLQTEGSVHSHDYTPDGSLLAVGTSDTRNYFVNLFDPATGNMIRRWPVGKSGRKLVLAFSPDGKTIASATHINPEVTLWDTATGNEKFPHEDGRTTTVRRMVILGDNRTLITQDEDGRVIRRDLQTGHITGDQEWIVPGTFESMSVSHDASKLLRSDLQKLRDDPQLKGSQMLADVGRYHPSTVILARARVSSDGNRVAVLFRPTRLNVYDRRTGKRLKQFGDPAKFTGPPTGTDLVMSADGTRVLCYCGPHHQAWNVETGERLPGEPFGVFVPDGALVKRSGSGVVLWNVDDGERIAMISDEPHRIGAVAFSPDGRWMAHARNGESPEVVLRDYQTHQVIVVLRGARGGTEALCFSPDGQTLCASTTSTLTVVWDLSSMK